jgi:hypothetical protein
VDSALCRTVPCYDLDLFELLTELLTGKSVPSSFRWTKLFPGMNVDALESKKKSTRNAAAHLFTEETLTVLQNMAQTE